MSEAAFPGGVRSRVGAARLLSDDRLTRRAVRGDERAFAAIFDRYHQPLYRFCLAIVGSPADAQDALQNTMVKVLGALPGEKRQIELKPWLYRIAHNEAVELLRRRRPTEELDPELSAGGSGLAEDAASRERLRRLLSDLEQLPERQRGTLVMRELAGLGFEEIGTALGTSPAVARQTLYEARQGLRQMDAGREMDCDAVTRALSDADGRVTRRRDIRAHLRSCPACRHFQEEIAGRREELGALAPLPAVAAAGLLQGLLGGAGASGGAGAGLAGAAAGGAAKSLGTGAAIKSAAAVVAVAAVGVGAAERGGVDVTPWGGGGSQQQESRGDGAGESAPANGVSRAAPGSDGQAGSATASPALGRGIDTGTAQRGKGGTGGDTGEAAPSTPASAGQQPSLAADRGPSEPHPSGRGHEKRHPEAASHGQQTAASHKGDGKGSGQSRGGGAGSRGASTKQAKAPKPTAKPPKPEAPAQAGQQAPSGSGANAAPKAPSDPGSAALPHPGPSPQAAEPKGPPTLAG
ncbi:MAG TPA: sigma-70 family RNA polymerase sigma factor [Solirubrobacterales bacterium]|nr:sigma-70 family RNA polymerase sigma factor [Solirubrobacterales bacterium]